MAKMELDNVYKIILYAEKISIQKLIKDIAYLLKTPLKISRIYSYASVNLDSVFFKARSLVNF